VLRNFLFITTFTILVWGQQKLVLRRCLFSNTDPRHFANALLLFLSALNSPTFVWAFPATKHDTRCLVTFHKINSGAADSLEVKCELADWLRNE